MATKSATKASSALTGANKPTSPANGTTTSAAKAAKKTEADKAEPKAVANGKTADKSSDKAPADQAKQTNSVPENAEKPTTKESEEIKTPAPKTLATKSPPPRADSDESSDISDSDSEDEGPPPMIEIEKSADIGAVRNSFLSATSTSRLAADEKKEIERLGKENLASITSQFEGKPKPSSPKEERERLTVTDREKYSKFKHKFENIQNELEKLDEQKKKPFQIDLENAGIEKEKLSEAKTKFESPADEFVPERNIDAILTDREKKHIKKTFEKGSKKAEPKECSVCGNTVYSVEKISVSLKQETRVYHKNCFKCCKCSKSLSVQSYYPHETKLYCKTHIMEIIRPDTVLDNFLVKDDDAKEDEEEDEKDYAKVNKPKKLDASVVKSGLKSSDDLGTLPSLKSTKSRWEGDGAGAADDDVDAPKLRKTEIEQEIFEPGKVKSRLSKFAVDNSENANEAATFEDENLNVEVGSMKSKWEKGDIEKARLEKESRYDELAEIKRSSMSVKERFKEGAQPADENVNRKSVLETEQIDFKSTGSVRDKFKSGEAFKDGETTDKSPREPDVRFSELTSVKERFEKGEPLDAKSKEEGRTAVVDVRCAELGNIKASFEQGNKESAEQAEQKRREIEEEFKNYKRISEKRRLEEQSEQPAEAESQKENPDAILKCAEMGSLKKRFEAGSDAFKSEEATPKYRDEQLEIKVAAKARELFKKIDEEGPRESTTSSQRNETSKWAKEAPTNRPEPVNKRSGNNEDDDAANDDFEVKNLLSKFKNIEQGKDDSAKKAPRAKRTITPPPADYIAELESQAKERDPNVVRFGDSTNDEVSRIRADAKNLKAKFEHISDQKDTTIETEEEKRKRLEEEFREYKEQQRMLNETAKDEEPSAVPSAVDADKEDLALAAESAQKMRQKWDKIQRKEAKKAQKAAQSQSAVRRTSQVFARIPEAELCFVCDKKVYAAEKIECDNKYYHKTCFRCKYCCVNLRMETFSAGIDGGIYCKNHYKELFNNMSRCLYDGRSREPLPANKVAG